MPKNSRLSWTLIYCFVKLIYCEAWIYLPRAFVSFENGNSFATAWTDRARLRRKCLGRAIFARNEQRRQWDKHAAAVILNVFYTLKKTHFPLGLPVGHAPIIALRVGMTVLLNCRFKEKETGKWQILRLTFVWGFNRKNRQTAVGGTQIFLFSQIRFSRLS